MRSTRALSALALTIAAAAAVGCSDSTAPTPAATPALGVQELRTDAAASSSTGQITTQMNASMCLDVAGASTDGGTPVILWPCSGNDNQQFTFTAAGELRVYDGTRCVDAAGGQGNDGDEIIIWSCNGQANQRWTRTDAGELKGINGKCMDLYRAQVENANKIILYTCNSWYNQKWNTPTPGGTSGGGTTPVPPPVQTPDPTPTTDPVDNPIPSGAAAKVFALMGPVPSVSAVKAMGGAFAKFEYDFAKYNEQHWANDGAQWDKANYYDRAMIYYVWWARTGNATYLNRANQLVVNYRKNYVESVNYGVPPHWAMFDGLALHYLLTGDEASRTAVGRIADTYAVPWYMLNLGNPSADMENRMQARVLLGFVVANYIHAPSQLGNNWASRAREALSGILASQASDGAYRFTFPGVNQCGYNKPWMVGLLNDAMVRYYGLFERDSRILPAVKRGVDYIWSRDWNSSAQAIPYLEGSCNGDGPTPAADLTNLVVSGFGFVYQQTHDQTYRTRGDAVFAGAVNGGWPVGSKQFNQEYTSGYRYLSQRQ